ncbi:hypothetical protein EJO68_10220 [Variovorax atrisoli]|nr:hypothetical protein [Variovorax sp. 369]RTD94802.1 hypothetical protein EJO68_10220 [Variovorax sp. 369]
MGLCVVLAGCGVAPLQPVKTPIPVECRVQRPTRPAMPTQALAPGVDLDRFAAAAMAEIELREGYELELNAALDVCTAALDVVRGR